jgi:uncharacterized protein
MRRVFADTFYYLALLNPGDEAHDRVSEFTSDYNGTMVTTDWVLTELADGLAGGGTRKAVIEFIEGIRGESSVRIVPATRKMLNRGWEVYKGRMDKEWSLTDCISLVVMRELRLIEVLTGDRHFEQMGFKALLSRGMD